LKSEKSYGQRVDPLHARLYRASSACGLCGSRSCSLEHPPNARARSKTSATRFTTRGSDSQKLGLGRRDSIARLRVLGTVHRPRVQSARRILSRSGFLTYISRCDGSRVRLRLRLIRRGVVEKLVHLRSDCASIEKPHELAPSCRIVSHCSSSAS
jgi:hypothetical protein